MVVVCGVIFGCIVVLFVGCNYGYVYVGCCGFWVFSVGFGWMFCGGFGVVFVIYVFYCGGCG